MNFCSRCVSNVSVFIESKLLDGHLTVCNVWGRFKPIYDDDIRCWRRGMETELPVIWDAITLMWFTDNVALWTPFTLFELGALQRMIQEGSVKWCLPPGSLHTVWQNFPESWWRHQMKTFFALPALCEGNPPVTGGFPLQRPVTRGIDVFFDLRLNKRWRKQPRRRNTD